MIELIKSEDHWWLDLFSWKINLPFPVKNLPKDCLDRYGIYFHMNTVVFCWGNRHKSVYLPWMWHHCRTEVMLSNGKFVPYEKFKANSIENIYREFFPYTYKLNNGEIQNRIVEVTVERRTWKWHWLKWAKWPRKISTSINVQFNYEIGERIWSWKGGVIGCGYDLLPNETPEQCLKRMELERKFN